jgi:hypothetical protein
MSGCLSLEWLGPRGGMAGGIMSWAGEDGQQLDNAHIPAHPHENDLWGEMSPLKTD